MNSINENTSLLLTRLAPLARSESEYYDNDQPTPNNRPRNGNKPNPGIDDGLLPPSNNEPFPGVDDGLLPQPDHPDTDVEIITPKEPEIPDFNHRAGFPKNPDDSNDGPDIETLPPKQPPTAPAPPHPDDSKPGEGKDDDDDDDIDGKFPPRYPGEHYPLDRPSFFDVELGSNPDLPDFNVYQHKKTLAQGMMDLALFSANANQLRYVLESYNRHPYFYPSIVLISFSLIFQVAIGVGLIWNATYNVKNEKEICIANRINNVTTIGIFFVTVINVFISAFGVANPSPTG